ncbi:MAG: glycosyltransferase family 4 protein [Actinomycetota bacterium]
MVRRARAAAARARKRYRQRRVWDAQMHPKLGFLSPLPPAPTGIATYSAAVLDGLRRIGFTDRHDLQVPWPLESKHEGIVPWYRLGIYQLGNNVEFHRDIYRFACQAPGLVVLHDLALDDFVRGMVVAGDPLGFVAEREAALLRSRLTSPDVLRNEPLRDPWCGHVVRRARGVIVHSAFCERYLRELGCRTPVFIVPHPVVESDRDMVRAESRGKVLRAPLEAAGARVVIGALGDLNEAKRIGEVVAAVATLGPEVHLALVGRRITGFDVDALVERSGIAERIEVHSDVSDDDFRGWLKASDVVVDLRHPHRGEVSGTLARAMQAGRPTVVSGTGTYLDVPDRFVVRVAPGVPDVDELASVLGSLAADDERRVRMGGAAAAHMRALAEGDVTARGYASAIEATLDLVGDPVRTSMARWAGALADVGVDDELVVREGYGLSYAEAFEEFTRTP